MNEQKAMKAYKVYEALQKMVCVGNIKQTIHNLKEAGFNLSDYRTATDVMQKYMRNNGEDGTATISEAVAKWYAKQGFDVQPEGIGWRIR